jgi:hypothetical protein
MNDDYIKKIEEENSALRKTLQSLEDDLFECNMWKPHWTPLQDGVALIIGKSTILGEVRFKEDWKVTIHNTLIGEFVTRGDAKRYLIQYLLEEKNG